MVRLRDKPCFTAAEARKAGVHPSLLSYYVKKGLLQRLGRGVYMEPNATTPVSFQWEELIRIAMSVPNGVVCLISALSYYELTDELPRKHWIAIPHGTTAPKRKEVRFIRMRNMSLGNAQEKIGPFSFQIFDRERTIIDAFRYLSREIAIKSLKAYFDAKGHKPDIRKIKEYAKKLRVPITPYLLTVTT